MQKLEDDMTIANADYIDAVNRTSTFRYPIVDPILVAWPFWLAWYTHFHTGGCRRSPSTSDWCSTHDAQRIWDGFESGRAGMICPPAWSKYWFTGQGLSSVSYPRTGKSIVRRQTPKYTKQLPRLDGLRWQLMFFGIFTAKLMYPGLLFFNVI